MLFLSERPAIPGAGRASEVGEHAREAEALIKEARRRRRRRWIRGTGAVLLVAAGATTWVLRESPADPPRAANTAAAKPTAAGGCTSAAVYGSLPSWARSGFSPPSGRARCWFDTGIRIVPKPVAWVASSRKLPPTSLNQEAERR